MARRTSRTPARVDVLVRALESGQTRQAAAATAGIARSTLYNWLDDRTFLDTIERAEGLAEGRMADVVVAAAGAGTWQAAAWWLERRRPSDYARRERLDQRVEVTDFRRKVGIVAERYGLDPADVMAEAEQVLAEAQAAER